MKMNVSLPALRPSAHFLLASRTATQTRDSRHRQVLLLLTVKSSMRAARQRDVRAWDVRSSWSRHRHPIPSHPPPPIIQHLHLIAHSSLLIYRQQYAHPLRHNQSLQHVVRRPPTPAEAAGRKREGLRRSGAQWNR